MPMPVVVVGSPPSEPNKRVDLDLRTEWENLIGVEAEAEEMRRKNNKRTEVDRRVRVRVPESCPARDDLGLGDILDPP